MASQHFNPKEVCVAIVFALARQFGIFSVFFFGGFPSLGTLVAS
jgi:hypothetical protein